MQFVDVKSKNTVNIQEITKIKCFIAVEIFILDKSSDSLQNIQQFSINASGDPRFTINAGDSSVNMISY